MSEKLVPVRDPSGQVGTVPESQLSQMPEGSTVVSEKVLHEATRQAQLEEKHAGIQGAATAWSDAAQYGASGGLLPAGISKGLGLFSPEWERAYKQNILEEREAYPTLSKAGEFAGIAGAAAAGGALAPGASAATRAATIGDRALTGLAQGAIEGGAFSGATEVSEAVLGDHELAAERLLAAVGHGALWGGAAGATFGTLMPSLSREGSAARREAEAEGAAIARPRSIEPLEPGGVRGWAAKEADLRTIKALGGTPTDVERLGSRLPTMAREIRADLEASTGKSIARHDAESINKYAVARRQELGDKLGGLMNQLDSKAPAAAPSVEAFSRRVDDEILKPALGGRAVPLPGSEDAVAPVRKWVQETQKAFGDAPPTFKEWQQARINLDKTINFNARVDSPAVANLKKLRGIMEGELEGAVERAEPKVGRALADEYRATKSLYQSVSKAETMTAREAARGVRRSSFGLLDTIAAASGVATGGPLGGIAFGLASKAVRAHGDQLAADILSRVAGVDHLARMSGKATARMQGGVRSVLTSKVPDKLMERRTANVRVGAASALFGEKKRDAFAKHSAALSAMASNPALATERISQSLGDMPHYAPKTAAAVTERLAGDVQFLQQKLPAPAIDPFSLTPEHGRHQRVTDSAIAKYARYLHALDDPLDVLDQTKKHTLTIEAVEAVKERRPLIYKEMQLEFKRQLADSKQPLNHATASRLSLLLDMPTSRLMTADVQRMLDQMDKAAATAPQQAPRGKAPNFADAYASEGDQLEKR